MRVAYTSPFSFKGYLGDARGKQGVKTHGRRHAWRGASKRLWPDAHKRRKVACIDCVRTITSPSRPTVSHCSVALRQWQSRIGRSSGPLLILSLP